MIFKSEKVEQTEKVEQREASQQVPTTVPTTNQGSIIGYISMCCCKDFSEANEGTEMNLLIPVEDLVSIWMDGNVNVQSFLPLVSNEICKVICERGFDVNYLAGVVMVEAYLLKLGLDLRIGSEGVALEKELRSWAVASISSFGNFYFFG